MKRTILALVASAALSTSAIADGNAFGTGDSHGPATEFVFVDMFGANDMDRFYARAKKEDFQRIYAEVRANGGCNSWFLPVTFWKSCFYGDFEKQTEGGSGDSGGDSGEGGESPK